MKKKMILLVEDNQSDIELTRRALKKARITNELVVAENGEEALNFLFGAGEQPGRIEPAVVLLDLKLPGVDGLEVLRQVRANPLTRRQPVVMLTSSREESDLARCYDSGVNSYIRKPVDFNQFVDAIVQIGSYWLTWNEMPPSGGLALNDSAQGIAN